MSTLGRRGKAYPSHIPPSGGGGLTNSDRVGLTTPSSGFRRRLQVDFSGYESSYDTGCPSSPRAGREVDPGRLLGSTRLTNPMRQAIHDAAKTARSMLVDQPLIGSQGQSFPCRRRGSRAGSGSSGDRSDQKVPSTPSEPADLIIVGNHPWPGDPMQSFKVILQHRAACRPGGVLVGMFWTDPREIDRSFPIAALRDDRGDRRSRGLDDSADVAVAHRIIAAWGSPAAFMLRWACELVVDRTVLVYSPPLTPPTRALDWVPSAFSPINLRYGKRQPRPSLENAAS